MFRLADLVDVTHVPEGFANEGRTSGSGPAARACSRSSATTRRLVAPVLQEPAAGAEAPGGTPEPVMVGDIEAERYTGPTETIRWNRG